MTTPLQLKVGDKVIVKPRYENGVVVTNSQTRQENALYDHEQERRISVVMY